MEEGASSKSIASDIPKAKRFPFSKKAGGGWIIAAKTGKGISAMGKRRKREDFSSLVAWNRYKSRMNAASKRSREKAEAADPERRERRIIWSRLYARYLVRGDRKQAFADWLYDVYSIDGLNNTPIEKLRLIAAKRYSEIL